MYFGSTPPPFQPFRMHRPKAVPLSPRTLTRAGADGKILIWRKKKHKIHRCIESAHGGPVTCMASSVKYIVSGGDDAIVNVWIPKGKKVVDYSTRQAGSLYKEFRGHQAEACIPFTPHVPLFSWTAVHDQALFVFSVGAWGPRNLEKPVRRGFLQTQTNSNSKNQ